MDPRIWHKIAALSGIAAVGLGSYLLQGGVAHCISLPFGSHCLLLLIPLIPILCYTVAYLEDRNYSGLAPFGGFSFIAAWATLLF